jgi:hypothetical protein
VTGMIRATQHTTGKRVRARLDQFKAGVGIYAAKPPKHHNEYSRRFQAAIDDIELLVAHRVHVDRACRLASAFHKVHISAR